MRKIHIEIYKRDKNVYQIPVGFSQYLNFRSRNQARDFLTKYKLVIEASVRSLSIEMGQIYSLYRMYYFQLDVFDSRHINECLDSFNKQCDYIFKEYSEGNSSFVFRAIETCFSECFHIIDIMKSFAQRHKETALKYQIYALHKTLDSVHNTYHEERKTIQQKANYLKTDSPVIKLKKAN